MASIDKVECTYGKKCYRLNPTHFHYNSHAHLEALVASQKGDGDVIIPEDFDTTLSHTIIRDQVKVILSQTKKNVRPRPQSDEAAGPSQKRVKAGESSSQQHSPTQQHKTSSHKAPSQKTAPPKSNAVERPGTFAQRWVAAAPYHFFLTRIEDTQETHTEDLSLSLQDLYDPSLGDLAASMQINFMIDINFLMPHIKATGNHQKPLLLLYETSNVGQAKNLPDYIKHSEIKTPSPYGHHHTKMSIMYYSDKSIRIVVSTANLIPADWRNYTQGVWVSPACPPLAPDSSSTGESPTRFKADLIAYLNFYKHPELREWVERLQQADLSGIKVCLVASVPGSVQGSDVDRWGLGRLKRLLRQHVSPRVSGPDWPVVVQCSSIGSLGANPADWLEGQMKAAMISSPGPPIAAKPPLYMIYPSLADIKVGLDGLQGGGCLPYRNSTHRTQAWLQEFLHRWRAEGRKRSRATPHIKSFCRIGPDATKIAYFLLTSANLSKAAWGRSSQKGQGQYIMSYEAGVLFLPKFLIEKDVFDVGQESKQVGEKFPVPFDLPLTQYGSSDKPWVADYLLS